MIYEARQPDTLKSGFFSLLKIPVNTLFGVFCPPKEKSPESSIGIEKSHQKQHQTLYLERCSSSGIFRHRLYIGLAGDPSTYCGYDNMFERYHFIHDFFKRTSY